MVARVGTVICLGGILGACVECQVGDDGKSHPSPGRAKDTVVSRRGRPLLPRETHVGESMFQVRTGRDDTPSNLAMTESEIADWAAACARIDGWEIPCQGAFILRAGTNQETRVLIGLMTEENIRAANVKIEDVDYVVVSRRP